MDRSKTPAYHSLYDSTSNLAIGNVSAWEPTWAQPTAISSKRSRNIGNFSIVNNSTARGKSRAETSNERAITAQYTGVLTAQHVNSVVYCAIVESKTCSPSVGICMIDPHTSFMRLTEILDSPTFVRTVHKLLVQDDIRLLEILVPNSYQKSKSNFVKILTANIQSNFNINYVPDHLFKYNEYSLNFICKNIEESKRGPMKMELGNKKYCLSSACACISYLETLPNHSFIHEKFNIKYESSEDSMFINASAIQDLELLNSNSTTKTGKKVTLFNYLNSTVTKMGERLLKNNIVQPLTNKISLLLRFETVKELIANDTIVMDLRIEMKSMVDLDNLFSYLCKKPKINTEEVNQQKLNFILLMKTMLMKIVTIRELMEPLNSKLLKEIINIFNHEDVNKTLELTSEYINEDCTWVSKPSELRNQKCYAIKVGYNGLLDASRQLYKTLIDEVLKKIDDLSEKYNTPLENRYDKNRGFYIFIKDFSMDSFEELENHPFINCIQRGHNLECVTMNITKLNLRIDSVLNEIFLMTEDTVDELIHKCRKSVSTFFITSEAVSLLDLMCSFAIVSTKPQYESYTCCEIDDNNVILKNVRNPLLENLFTSDKKHENKVIISNDVTIIDKTSRVQIITGPNMSGKSIYIKQFCINVILAQIGMFIPAEFATMKIFKSLFTRIANDANKPNLSTFSMEMVEMSFILQNADKDSLIIIDELGRGTGYKDCMALCISIIEKIRNMGATCMFVTHFVGIPKIFQNKPGVFELHMGVSKDNTITEDAKFKISPGINWVSGYGIEMIKKNSLFPDEIIQKAEILSDKIKISKDASMINSELQNLKNKQNKLILNCYEMLNHIVHNVPDNELFAAASQLEDSFIAKYEEINPNMGIDAYDNDNESEISEPNTEATTIDIYPLKPVTLQQPNTTSLIDFTFAR